MKATLIHSYEDMCKVIEEIGILPLSSLIPEHPSLESLTPKEAWHSDTENDPWLWRAKFPADGVAAYGKFLKKKAVLVSAPLFPLFRAALAEQGGIVERYERGLLSKYARDVYEVIAHSPGIETRALRAEVGMKAKEMKKEFDAALVELQGNADIVISGVKERTNELGEKNGWNSTSFEVAEHWMNENGLETVREDRTHAKEKLLEALENYNWNESALAYINKVIKD